MSTETGTDLVVQRVGPLLLDVLANLHADCFEDAWSRETLARLLAMPGTFALLATKADAGDVGEPVPVGFAFGRVAAGECEILSIGVHPQHRCGGAGRALVAALLTKAGADGAAVVFLEVSIENAPAQALYRKLGFREVGRRPDYYHLPDGRRLDALLMRCRLSACANADGKVLQFRRPPPEQA